MIILVLLFFDISARFSRIQKRNREVSKIRKQDEIYAFRRFFIASNVCKDLLKVKYVVAEIYEKLLSIYV